MDIKKMNDLFIRIDKFCEYIPFASSVTNFVDLFEKCVLKIIPPNTKQLIIKHKYFTYLDSKSFYRCAILLIPIFGNIIIGIYDFRHKKPEDKKLSESEILDQARSGTFILTEEQTKDSEFMFRVIQTNFNGIKYASPNLTSDKQFMLRLIDSIMSLSAACFVHHMGENLKSDREVMEKVLRKNSSLYTYLGKELRNDPDFIKNELLYSLNALNFASKDLRNDPTFMKECIKMNSWAVSFASKTLKHNMEFMSDLFREEDTNVRSILENCDKAFLKNKDFMEKVAVCDPILAMQYADEALKADPEYVLFCVEKNGLALKYAQLFCEDEQIVRAAIKNNGFALEFAAEKFKSDLEYVYLAVENAVYPLVAELGMPESPFAFMSKTITSDKDKMSTLIKSYPKSFKFADEALRADPELAFQAVTQSGEMLCYVSDKLKSDLFLVKLAMDTHPLAFEWASEGIRGNLKVVLELITLYPDVIQFVTGDVRTVLTAFYIE